MSIQNFANIEGVSSVSDPFQDQDNKSCIKVAIPLHTDEDLSFGCSDNRAYLFDCENFGNGHSTTTNSQRLKVVFQELMAAHHTLGITNIHIPVIISLSTERAMEVIMTLL